MAYVQTPVREETIQGAGDVNLFVRSWRPEGIARAVVAIVPGFNSHSGYYGWVAAQLVAHGLAVYAIDLRGRGRSDGERSLADYVADVGSLMTLARSREQALPVFLLGHSAGGVVACLYAADHQPELAGLICESFAYHPAAAHPARNRGQGDEAGGQPAVLRRRGLERQDAEDVRGDVSRSAERHRQGDGPCRCQPVD